MLCDDMMKLHMDQNMKWEICAVGYRHVAPNILKPDKVMCLQNIWGGGNDDANAELDIDPLDLADPATVVHHHGPLGCEYDEDDGIHGTEAGSEQAIAVIDLVKRELTRERMCRARKRTASNQKASRPKAFNDEDPDAVIVEKGRSGWSVWRGEDLLGKMSFPIHWQYPTIHMKCFHPDHGHCTATLPSSDANEQKLVDWVSKQDSSTGGRLHKTQVPLGLPTHEQARRQFVPYQALECVPRYGRDMHKVLSKNEQSHTNNTHPP